MEGEEAVNLSPRPLEKRLAAKHRARQGTKTLAMYMRDLVCFSENIAFFLLLFFIVNV